MNVPMWVVPGVWGGIVGAIATMSVGFWAIGWTTAGTTDRMAKDRADSAVVAALLPFCVANAERDPEKLAKARAEQSSHNRTQLVADSGWATMPGMTKPDRLLASACSDKLAEEQAEKS